MYKNHVFLYKNGLLLGTELCYPRLVKI